MSYFIQVPKSMANEFFFLFKDQQATALASLSLPSVSGVL